LIHAKVEESIAKAIRDTLGYAFPFEGEPQSDADFGQQSKHSFWVPLTIRGFDETKALRKIKGEQFSGNFSRFLSSLKKLNAGGVAGLADIATRLRQSIRKTALKNLQLDLQHQIAQLLGAEVQGVSATAYTWLQKQALGGVCCRSEKSDPSSMAISTDEAFWVASAATVGTDGPAGLCPAVSEEANPPCAATPESREKIQLHHRPYTECFNLAELQNFEEEPLLTAKGTISSKCG